MNIIIQLHITTDFCVYDAMIFVLIYTMEYLYCFCSSGK